MGFIKECVESFVQGWKDARSDGSFQEGVQKGRDAANKWLGRPLEVKLEKPVFDFSKQLAEGRASMQKTRTKLEAAIRVANAERNRARLAYKWCNAGSRGITLPAGFELEMAQAEELARTTKEASGWNADEEMDHLVKAAFPNPESKSK